MKQALVFISTLASVKAFAPYVLQQPRTNSVLNMNSINEDSSPSNRRQVLSNIFGGVVTTIASSATVVNALDMDAFMNAELANDTKNCDPKRDPKCLPKMTSDEAECKYGQGKAKVEACRRLKQAGKEIPKENQGKSLGGAYAM